MTSSSNPQIERGLDAMLIVYSLLNNHPASTVCEQFIRTLTGWFTTTFTLFEAKAILTKVYAADAALTSQKLAQFAAGPIVVVEVDLATALAAMNIAAMTQLSHRASWPIPRQPLAPANQSNAAEKSNPSRRISSIDSAATKTGSCDQSAAENLWNLPVQARRAELLPNPRVHLDCSKKQPQCYAGSHFRFQRLAADALGWVVTGDQGIGPARIRKIYNRYGAMAAEVVKADPYRLIQEIEGIGFQSADSIAWRLGVGAVAAIQRSFSSNVSPFCWRVTLILA